MFHIIGRMEEEDGRINSKISLKSRQTLNASNHLNVMECKLYKQQSWGNFLSLKL